MLSATEESVHPPREQEKAAAAVTWLTSNRRGEGYWIVHRENAAYRFRLTLYGAKPLGIAIALTAGVISGWPVISAVARLPPTAVVGVLKASGLEERIGFPVSVASLIAWFVVATANWVRSSAEQYARTLLETCDSGVACDRRAEAADCT